MSSITSLSQIPSNYHCHRRIYKLVWGDYACPHCNKSGLIFRSSYEWCPHCRKKHSVKATTFFRYSKLTYKDIYTLIWCWQHRWTVSEIRKATGLSYLTIRRWIWKFREQLPKDKTRLYGEVEVDESFFGKRKYGKQRLAIGAIERHTKQIKLQLIHDRSRATCEGFIRRSVRPGSFVATDGLESYNELAYLGYDWTSCNHNIGIFGPTNQIECVWSVIKRHIRRVHRVLAFSHEELALILKEWEVRHNRPDLFYNVDNYLFTCSGLLH